MQTCGDPVFTSPGSVPQVEVTLPQRPQTLCMRLTVRDSFLESAGTEVRLVVGAEGEAPRATPPTLRVHPGQAVQLLADPNARAPADSRFTWLQTVGPAVQLVTLEADGVGPELRFVSPAEPAELAFWLRAVRPGQAGPEAVARVTVLPPEVNAPPEVTLFADPQTPAPGDAVMLYATGLDAEQDPLTGALSWGTAPTDVAVITVEAPGERPAVCGPLPHRDGLPAGIFQARLTAPSTPGSFSVAFTLCDALGACAAVSTQVQVTEP